MSSKITLKGRVTGNRLRPDNTECSNIEFSSRPNGARPDLYFESITIDGNYKLGSFVDINIEIEPK